MPFIEHVSAGGELGVGRLGALHSLGDTGAHLLGPSLALDVRHPVGHEQLENARAEPGGNSAPPPPAGDDSNGWGELV
jgi:hypothetical protein